MIITKLSSHQTSSINSSINTLAKYELRSIIFHLVVVFGLVYCFAQLSNAEVPCGSVDMQAAPCITYATGQAPMPSNQCCKGLKALAQSVKTVDDKKAICRCLKAGVKNFGGA